MIPGDDSCYTVSRQVIPGEFEPCPQNSSIIVHYKIQVDVVDSRYTLVATRTQDKQIQINFTGLTPSSDVAEIADSLIGQSDLLPERRRASLLKALTELKAEMGRPQTLSTPIDTSPRGQKAPKSAPPKRPETASQVAVTLSKSEVDRLLNDALRDIHFGEELTCIKTLEDLSNLAQYDRNLSLIIQHEPLMNTLINGLKKFASSSLPACIYIVGIFEKMSYFSNYQESIARFKIGAMSLSLLHAQVALASVAAKSLQAQARSQYLSTQNQLLTLVISLLFNLAENPSAMRKMVNKDVVGPLTQVLRRSSPDLVSISLRFLRKISNVPVNWQDVTFDVIISYIATRVFKWKYDRPELRVSIVSTFREAVELLYSFSFHPESIAEFKKCEVFSTLAGLSALQEIRAPMIKFFYKCAMAENLDEYFRNTELLNLLIATTTVRCDERTIALVILAKLSADREIASVISQSDIFSADHLRLMFVQATERQTAENRLLLKMIRNIADHQSSFVEGFE
jgi:hypothetical protein